jgi:very-short-patch-repair endonuclease
VNGKVDTANHRVAKIAARQHGVVSIRQLREAGVGDDAVRWRVRSGLLHRVHRGVYAVGHAGLSYPGRWMAAVLAFGDRAVLSHRSAAALLGLLRPFDGPIEVSVPSGNGRLHRAGVRLHRCPSLAAKKSPPVVVRHRGIPVTSAGRTIADLRGVVSPSLVRRAIRQAEMLGLPLGPGVEADGTRSDLERDFLRLCRRSGLPAPEVNVPIGRWTVDFLWRADRLAVETDSYRWHRGQVAFDDDHARDLDLRRRGFEIRRYTERQVRTEPERVAADLREALGPAS